jgi:hypothetical protein
MPISSYNIVRDLNADITPGNIRADEFPDQQIVNAIRQIMADLAAFAGSSGTNIDTILAGMIASTKVTVITASGTFNTDAKCLEAWVDIWGGGGAGGGVPATAAGQSGAGGGGHAGAKASRRLTAAQLGASQAVTIGAGGVGTNAAGPNGSASTFGALISAAGGLGGLTTGATASLIPTAVTGSAQSATGDIRGHTFPGERGVIFSTARSWGGNGGSNEWGGGGIGAISAGNGIAGANGLGFGAGGGGGSVNNVATGAGVSGGNGNSGICIVREFLKL